MDEKIQCPVRDLGRLFLLRHVLLRNISFLVRPDELCSALKTSALTNGVGGQLPFALRQVWVR